MNNQVNIEEMNPEQSLDTIWNLINKAASKGAFTIDECYILKVLFSKLNQNLSIKIEKENSHKSS